MKKGDFSFLANKDYRDNFVDKPFKLGIGIPNMGTIKTKTAFSLMRALKQYPLKHTLIFQEGSILHAIRENIIKVAIKEGCTHLLFLDTDMYFEEDAIVRLLARNKDIIGVHYNTRKFPAHTTVNFLGKKRTGLVKCQSVATGLMLIDLKVFKKLNHPWFFWKSDSEGGVEEGEDFWFCRIAREAGFDVWGDLTVKVGHIGDTIF